MSLLSYRNIEIGEPDANVEYMQALKQNKEPTYIKSYYNLDLPNFEQFSAGTKFIIIGQKGTGKTAVLRYLEKISIEQGYTTDFIVFKNTILKESELYSVNDYGVVSPLIDEEKIYATKYYLHTIKRILISVIIAAMHKEFTLSDSSGEENKTLIHKILKSGPADVVRAAYDSIFNIVKSAGIEVEKLSKGRVSFDPAIYIKRNNDQLLSDLIKNAKESQARIRIYLDELHFSYRDADHVASDSALVRDAIVSCINLNERFIQEGVDITLYIGVRSEFLEQPEIGYADIVQTIESYGEQINWETYPANATHPIFDLVALRFCDSSGERIARKLILSSYLKGVDPVEFLRFTWCKPRDVIRYFKYCKAMYPDKIQLNYKEYGAVIRQYSIKSWDEMRSAIGAFVPSGAINEFEKIVKSIVPGQYDGSVKLDFQQFSAKFKPILGAISNGKDIKQDQLMDWLYKIGLYYFEYEDSNGNVIYQQYHRGNRTPTKNGQVKIHLAVAKALG